MIVAGATELFHDGFAPLCFSFRNGGYEKIVGAPQTVGVLLQLVRWNPAHFHTTYTRNRTSGQGQPEFRRDGFSILPIRFKEVVNLKKYHTIRVALLDIVIQHRGRFQTCLNFLARQIGLIRSHGFRGKVVIFAHQILYALCYLFPRELNHWAVPFSVANPFAIVIHTALSGIGQCVRMAAYPVFLSQKVRLFFWVVLFLKKAVNPFCSTRKSASARQGFIDLVFCNEWHDRGKLGHGSGKCLAGQVQFFQAVQQTTEIVIVVPHNRTVLLISCKKCPIFGQKGFTEIRIGKASIQTPFFFRKVLIAKLLTQAAERICYPVLHIDIMI